MYSTLEARSLARTIFGSSKATTRVIPTCDEPSTTFLVYTRRYNLSTSSYITYRYTVGLEVGSVGLFGGVSLVYILVIFGLTIIEELSITIDIVRIK